MTSAQTNPRPRSARSWRQSRGTSPATGGGQSMDQNKVAELAQAESEVAALRQLSSDEDNVTPARERNINRLAQRVKQLKAELGL